MANVRIFILTVCSQVSDKQNVVCILMAAFRNGQRREGDARILLEKVRGARGHCVVDEPLPRFI